MIYFGFIKHNYGAKELVAKSIAIFLVSISAAIASPSSCPEHYFEGERAEFTNQKLEKNAKELCSSGHAVWYSGVARAPIWSAQFLTKGRLEQARGLPRSNNFREDSRVPNDWRNKLNDFRGSGYDRGHMAPSGDMPNPNADSDSFLLTNIVAQDAQLNRNLWSAIEAATRAHAMHRSLYVYTGPLFLGDRIKRLNNRVLIPTHVYKLLYEPQRNLAAAYLVENAPDKRHKAVSLQELEKLSGVRFLPSAISPGQLKLPRPRYR